MKKKPIILFSAFAVMLVMVFLTIFAFTNKAYKLGIEDIRQSEMRYAATKSLLITEVKNYIQKTAPESGLKGYAIVEECEEEEVSIIFAMAQAELESHFGTKGIAAKTNCPWNVGSFDNLSYNQILSKYKYSDPNNSIKPYLKLLKNRYLTDKIEYGLMENFIDMNGNRYASDEHYEERLRYKYEFIKATTQIDSLEKDMKYWAIKANRW